MRSIEHLLTEEVTAPNWRRGPSSAGTSQAGGRGRGAPTGPASAMGSTMPLSNRDMGRQGNPRWKPATGEPVAPLAQQQHQQQQQQQQQQPHQKYESRYKNTEVDVEDTILNKIILNKLNKFSTATYKEVRDFLYQILDSGETDFTKEFMRLVFRKAAAEEIFCPLYAKLLNELRATYPVIQTEMVELFESYLTIFKNMDEISATDYNAFVERNTEKKYRLGYSQFLAELVTLEAVDLASLEKTFSILIMNIYTLGVKEHQNSEIQEYTDCLLRMSRVLHKKNTNFFINLRKVIYAVVQEKLDWILESPRDAFQSISPKARFALMDIRDNLQNK
jgi:hypothetical protein